MYAYSYRTKKKSKKFVKFLKMFLFDNAKIGIILFYKKLSTYVWYRRKN